MYLSEQSNEINRKAQAEYHKNKEKCDSSLDKNKVFPYIVLRLREKGFGGEIPSIEKFTPIYIFFAKNCQTFVSHRTRSVFSTSNCSFPFKTLRGKIKTTRFPYSQSKEIFIQTAFPKNQSTWYKNFFYVLVQYMYSIILYCRLYLLLI